MFHWKAILHFLYSFSHIISCGWKYVNAKFDLNIFDKKMCLLKLIEFGYPIFQVRNEAHHVQKFQHRRYSHQHLSM